MKPSPYVYRAEVTSIYDGDTLNAILDLGMSLKMEVACRLHGLDTPEIHGKSASEKEAAVRARDRLRELLLGKLVLIHSVAKPDKYGRLLCEVWTDDIHINQLLLDEGHARPYSGGTKSSWE